MNTQFDDLIAKHLSGTLREDEKQLLALLLKVPENQLYLAAKIDEAFRANNGMTAIDAVIGTATFQKIRDQIAQEPAAGKVVPVSWYRTRPMRWIGVAASLVLIISVVLLWNANRSKEQQGVAQKNDIDSTSSVVVHEEVNTTGKEKSIALSDGSLIILADQSRIIYREPFSHKRDITLTGKARFRVAKDKTSPFTVTSGSISTTALGTEFTVAAWENERPIVVRLYEGKVVVKAVNKLDKWMKDDIYLIPGQEFIYDGVSMARVNTFTGKKATVGGKVGDEALVPDEPSLPKDDKGSWYMFNNQSLGQVLDQLSAMYKTKIVYNPADVKNIDFTVKYNRSESLETILKRIGTINNLTITKTDTAFIISR